MAISLEEVDKMAKLARLRYDEGQKQKLIGELSGILDYVGQLKKLAESAKLEPGSEDPDSINLMRNDVAEPADDPKEFIRQAPWQDGEFVKVKSVLQ